jgi:uncharacterized surface protein with fasciclin (FAS1) repeats
VTPTWFKILFTDNNFNMKKLLRYSGFTFAFYLVVLAFAGCKKQDIRETTTDDVNIVDYLRRYPEKFSEYVKILDRTNVSPFLNAYGTYTTFAPTNDAFKLYLQQTGKTSTDDITIPELLDLARLHIIADTLSTQTFTDGKIAVPTMYGQYLTTNVESGLTIVNRQGIITEPNVRASNGIIHVVDHVLQPAKLTAAKLLEQDPKFSIFTQALKATGFYDSININNNPDPTRRWLTVLAESDSVLKAAGYNNYAALVAKYNNTGNPKNPDDSLFLYVSYHILPGIKYVADLVSASSHPTLAPLSVVSVELDNQTVLINQAIFNGALEPGVALDRPNSDRSATNGVIHYLLGDIYLKVRTPIRVDFDLAAQPEIIKLTSIYHKPGKNQDFALGELKDVTWQNGNLRAAYYHANSATTTDNYWWNDGFDTNLRFGNAAANNWIEFVTPLLVRGKYKVWICYRRGATGQYTQVSFDGAPLPRIVDLTAFLPSSTATDAVLESQGFKRYTVNSSTTNVGQLAGTVDVQTTDRHRIRLTAIRDAGSGATNTVTLDFIQFIPINDVQYRPIYAKDGTVVP